MRVTFNDYNPGKFYDELFLDGDRPRDGSRPFIEKINNLEDGELELKQTAVELALRNMGITFTVYGNKETTERIFPFDIIPRIISADEWENIKKGLEQRALAVNSFIDDIYHESRILRDKIIPEEIVYGSKNYLPECSGLDLPYNAWANINGCDLVRDGDGTIYVLEDNLRCPSGVSYVIENRFLMKRIFPNIFQSTNIQPIDDYPLKLLEMLTSIAPGRKNDPTIVLLTPGQYNSAYFEHSFLAQQMGVELVEGRDLVVNDGYLYMRTTKGLQRIDVVYRRIDDVFLDPLVFRKDSLLGVPGIFDVFRKGNLAIANAPGTGLADDKVIYYYVPDMINYYLKEEPLLPNVPTYICNNDQHRKYVLGNIDKMVVKAANESGGYGMLIGNRAGKKELGIFKEKIKKNPRNYIAQPILTLSRVPALIDGRFEGRHVDFRPFILQGKEIYIMPGGLTRVALVRDSLVVNSSQGGGSKDTWVLASVPATGM